MERAKFGISRQRGGWVLMLPIWLRRGEGYDPSTDEGVDGWFVRVLRLGYKREWAGFDISVRVGETRCWRAIDEAH